MLTRDKLQAGEGTLEPYNSEIRHAHRRRKMDANDAHIEMEANFHKVFYMMADKVDKLFADYEEHMAKERKGSEVLLPFTHLGHVAEIFKPLGVSLGASLESRLPPCS